VISTPMLDKSITYTEKCFTGNWLIDLGYRDYIAARFLLNSRFVVQGLTLASTAVEKYLKAVIVFNSKEREKYHYHFDNLEKLLALVSKSNHKLIEKVDPVFFELLESAFKIRYYDKIKNPIFIGIYLNQFIGELDSTIDLLEKFIAQTQNGETFRTGYKRAIENKDPHLYENNFILTHQNKKDFMEKPDDGFSIYLRVGGSTQEERIVKAKDIVNKYDGRIATFKEFSPYGDLSWFENT
jgi:HEPN domain-containing protein